jgi:hypothetical protein
VEVFILPAAEAVLQVQYLLTITVVQAAQVVVEKVVDIYIQLLLDSLLQVLLTPEEAAVAVLMLPLTILE